MSDSLWLKNLIRQKIGLGVEKCIIKSYHTRRRDNFEFGKNLAISIRLMRCLLYSNQLERFYQGQHWDYYQRLKQCLRHTPMNEWTDVFLLITGSGCRVMTLRDMMAVVRSLVTTSDLCSDHLHDYLAVLLYPCVSIITRLLVIIQRQHIWSADRLCLRHIR